MSRLIKTAAAVSAMVVILIIGFLIVAAFPLLLSGEFFSLLAGSWRTSVVPPQHGIAPMIAGSFCLSLLAVLLAFPAAVGICSFAHSLGPRPLRRPVLALVHLMTGIPTVIYGFVSVFLLVPLLRGLFDGSSGFSLLAATLALAVLVLPTIALLLHVQLRQVDPGMILTCTALGMSPSQTLLRVLLPVSRSGLVAAAVLGLCRAVGDTLIALMVAGNATQFPGSPLDSIRTLTSHIALVLATDTHSEEYRSVFAAGLLLFCMTALLSLAIRRLCRGNNPHPSDAQVA